MGTPSPTPTPTSRINGYTVSGAGSPQVNGFYREGKVESSGRRVYTKDDGSGFCIKFLVDKASKIVNYQNTVVPIRKWQICKVGEKTSWYTMEQRRKGEFVCCNLMLPPATLPRCCYHEARAPGPHVQRSSKSTKAA